LKKKIYFLLKGNNNGWIGLGLGNNMSGMDTIVITFNNDSTVNITDRFSSGYFEPETDT
jgi:hypothetical protein